MFCKLRGLLKGDIKATEPKPFRLVKSLYQSCMNQKKIEEKGMEKLKDILKKLGGWPLLEGDKWDQKGFKWFNLVYKFREVGFSANSLVAFSIVPDLKNSIRRILDLDQPQLGLSREYLVKGMKDKDVQVSSRLLNNICKI